MSALPPRSVRSRALSRRAAGAAAAGLTAVLAASPFAHAAPAPTSTDTATSAPASPSHAAPSSSAASSSSGARASASSSATHGTAHAKSAPTSAVVKKKAITADDVVYGFQKYRVGVQVKSGQYIPPGTTTVGTKLHVVETGPNANDADPGDDFTCTTVADSPSSSSSSGSASVSGAVRAKSSSGAPTGDASATYCQPPQADDRVAARIEARYRAAYGRKLPARLRAMLTTRPTPDGADGDYAFTAEPGDTITITQVDAAPLLRQDPTASATLAPCEANPSVPIPTCGTGTFDFSNGGDFAPTSTDEIFDDLGPLPVARDDSATTEAGTSVNIAVTKNDTTSGAKKSGLAVGDDPKHGTATVLSGSSGAAGQTPTQPPPASSEPISLAPSSSASSSTSSSVPTILPPLRVEARGLRADVATVKVGTTIRYTPKAGFTGTDHFTYRLSTVNGSDTAEVTVKVVAAPSSVSASSTGGNGTAPLAVTGSDTAVLGEVALGLLAAGGVAVAAGRRRQTVRGGRTH